MKFSNAFQEMDNYIQKNLHSITCNEIFEIKKDFYNIVELQCGSTANLTGITELLVFRFMFHALEMTGQIQNKSVQNGSSSLKIGNRYIGMNGKYQEPDIVIEQDGIIKFLLSIKNLLSTIAPTSNEKESTLVQELIKKNGVCTNSIQDIFRIDNIRYGQNSNFKSLTIVFSKPPLRHKRAIELIHQKFDWHRFLILENNNNTFLNELNDKLGFLKKQRQRFGNAK